MLFDTNLNFLNFLLGCFLTVSRFTHSFSSEARSLTFIFLFGLIGVLYLFYKSLKNFFDRKYHSKYLIVVREVKEGSIIFEVDGSYKSELNSTFQLIYRDSFKAKFQLFENSYFNYLTCYRWWPLVQFKAKIQPSSFFLELIPENEIVESITNHNVLEALIFESTDRGDFLLYHPLKLAIHGKIFMYEKLIEAVQISITQTRGLDLTLDNLPLTETITDRTNELKGLGFSANPKTLRILKEEIIDLVSFLKPSAALGPEEMTVEQLKSEINLLHGYSLKVKVRTVEPKDLNPLDTTNAQVEINPRDIQVGPFKYNYHEIEGLVDDSPFKDQFRSQCKVKIGPDNSIQTRMPSLSRRTQTATF